MRILKTKNAHAAEYDPEFILELDIINVAPESSGWLHGFGMLA